VNTLLQVLGGLVIAVGIGLVYIPAGIIALGGLLLAIGYINELEEVKHGASQRTEPRD
jgi:hypothetical protein